MCPCGPRLLSPLLMAELSSVWWRDSFQRNLGTTEASYLDLGLFYTRMCVARFCLCLSMSVCERDCTCLCIWKSENNLGCHSLDTRPLLIFFFYSEKGAVELASSLG